MSLKSLLCYFLLYAREAGEDPPESRLKKFFDSMFKAALKHQSSRRVQGT